MMTFSDLIEMMMRQLALSRRLRRKVIKEKRREMSRRVNQLSSISFVIEDYGDESWTSDDGDDDSDNSDDGDSDEHHGDLGSARLRDSRVTYMKTIPNCHDRDMAQRFRAIKEVVKNFGFINPFFKSDQKWSLHDWY